MSDAPESGPGSQAFSLELGEDLARTRDWLHEFAGSVIRPAGAEWDEREHTPWPGVEAAGKSVPDSRLAARVRGVGDPAGRRGMGRARATAVAGARGGGQDRAVLAGLLHPAVPGAVRARHSGRVRGTVLG